MKPLRVLPRARAGISEVFDYLWAERPQAAYDFAQQLAETFTLLRQFPEAGAAVQGLHQTKMTMRSWAVRGFDK